MNTNKVGLRLDLFDGNGNTRAVLGRTTTYPDSSLLLFNPEGNVIWSGP